MTLNALRLALHRRPVVRQLIAGTIWSALGEALSRGLMLVSLVIVARILGREQYGELGLLRTTIGTFATLGGVGLGLTANRFVAEYYERDPVFAGKIIGSTYLVAGAAGAIVSIAVAALARPLAQQMLGHVELAASVQVSAALMFLGAINGAQTGVLQGLEAYRRLSIANGGQGICGLLALPLGAALFGTDGALGGLVVYTVVGAFLFQAMIAKVLRERSIPISFTGINTALPIFWRFSVPAALMGVAIAPFKWLCEAFLAKGAGFGQLGLFHAGMLVANVFIALVSTLNAPLISLAARSSADSAQARTYINLYGTWYLFLVLAFPILLFPSLPGVLLGKEFAGVEFSRVTLLLVVYGGLILYYQGIVRVVAQGGSMWLALLTNIIEGIVLIGSFAFVTKPTAFGLSVAYIGSYAARIAVSVPMLTMQRLVTPGILFERKFLITVVAMVGIVLMQLDHLK